LPWRAMGQHALRQMVVVERGVAFKRRLQILAGLKGTWPIKFRTER
jgi:hypothetical protein